jgi:hypothetical protein
MSITIPEKWLGAAKYPVVVDPVIGTTTIGSQITGPDPNNPGYDRPWLDGEYSMNKYLVPQNGNGQCTAYVYCYNTGTDSSVVPCSYTNVNNKPYKRISQNEKTVNVAVWPPNLPVGWRNNTFVLNENITASEYVWFGFYGGYFTTRFDYGGECYKGWFNYNLYPDYEDEGEAPPYMTIGSLDTYCTIKWSWYFDYIAITSQNFVRTVAQGVTLIDNRKLAVAYSRLLNQIVFGAASLNKFKTMIRFVSNITSIIDFSKKNLMYGRKIINNVSNTVNTLHGKIFFRKNIEAVQVSEKTGRGLLFFIRIVTGVLIRDYILWRFLKARSNIVIKSVICREINLDSKIA